MIKRPHDIKNIAFYINHFPITAILGPRQSGKTTLSKEFHADYYFDMENPRDIAKLKNPLLTLEKLSGLIVIDEIQRNQDLFPILRYLVDTNKKQKYLILGSASPLLIKQSSESLAGRIAFYILLGFRKSDISKKRINALWLRGGLPISFLAKNDDLSFLWRQNYIQTFLERDIPNFGLHIPAITLNRFWKMLAHYHGNILNLSELGRSLGVADTTIKHYIDILTETYMIRMLQPWHINIKKRLIKRPKIYIRDSGIMHSLLSIESFDDLLGHPKLGSSWEGFALEQIWRSINKPDNEAYFWGVHSGAEIDLLWRHKNKLWACEFKYQDAPTLTKSMLSALETLNLEKIWVIYPGKEQYKIHSKIVVFPFSDIPSLWKYE